MTLRLCGHLNQKPLTSYYSPVPVCILTNYATKQNKIYGSHMKANVEENTILMCPKIGLYHTEPKNALLLTIISNIFRVKL